MVTEPYGEVDDEFTQPPSRKAIATLLGDEGNSVPGDNEHAADWGWY